MLIVAESFFHTLKVEKVYDQDYKTRFQAKQSIFQYIECYYNHHRRHSAIGNCIPMEYEYNNFLKKVVSVKTG
ncbi:MAG: hypothetical protein COC15_04580 [Legionellales bacterium]|nr:MAG: hypothetical protein COC15_04580 [Legionellales bacterium]